MVGHDIDVKGVQLSGATQSKPVVLQMDCEDFPAAFLRDLSAMPPPNTASPAAPPLSSTITVAANATSPGTLYHPVSRVFHVALVQLTCESVGSPRLNPRRVLSAGVVIRRVPRSGGVSELSKSPETAWPWMKNRNGQFGWIPRPQQWTPDDDPDPQQRPQLQSGQPALDQWLATQTRSTALTESATPAFVASPEVCNAAQRTLVYAMIPTASNEASTMQPANVPPASSDSLFSILPRFLKSGQHVFPQAGQYVDYQLMSDEYAKAQNKSDFLPFSAALRTLYTVFGALDGSPAAQPFIDLLNNHFVTLKYGLDYERKPMGTFYQEAAAALIEFDPHATPPKPTLDLMMPVAWDLFSPADQTAILGALGPLLQARGQAAAPPLGRFQDASRYYRIRMYFRIKGETPGCPPKLVWSSYSDPFRLAAWYESAGRAVAPVPLPDLFDRNVLKNAKPSASFAVPPSLMNAMQGATLTGLSGGSASAGAGGGIGLTWICGFSIPLITICAFFVLNIFLVLLNIVFFWLPFIKICIPFPVPAPSSPGTED